MIDLVRPWLHDKTTESASKRTETANIIKHNAMAPNGYNLEIFSPNRILTKEGLENISKNNQGLFKKKNKTSKYMGVYSSANSLYIEIARRNRKYKKDTDAIKKILKSGSEKANIESQKTIKEVHKIVGLSLS